MTTPNKPMLKIPSKNARDQKYQAQNKWVFVESNKKGGNFKERMQIN